jgi:hypothetical protein
MTFWNIVNEFCSLLLLKKSLWERILFRGNEFKFMGTIFISWERILFRGNEFLCHGDEFYFVGTKSNSWERILFRGNEFKFMETNFISWERILFRGNAFYFVGTNFISWERILRNNLIHLSQTVWSKGNRKGFFFFWLSWFYFIQQEIRKRYMTSWNNNCWTGKFIVGKNDCLDRILDPGQFLDMMVFSFGLHFALRAGQEAEHRNLRGLISQYEMKYLEYTEHVSKCNVQKCWKPH